MLGAQFGLEWTPPGLMRSDVVRRVAGLTEERDGPPIPEWVRAPVVPVASEIGLRQPTDPIVVEELEAQEGRGDHAVFVRSRARRMPSEGRHGAFRGLGDGQLGDQN